MSSMKPPSLVLHTILKMFRGHFQNYCAVAGSRSNRNGFWSIDGSFQFLQFLNKVGRSQKASCITAGDFGTLYTSLPHAVIKIQIFHLIDLCFRNAGKTYVRPEIKSPLFSYARYSNESGLRKEEVKELVECVVDNTFVNFAGFIFRQKQGIPMGGNASPMLADLTLTMLEYSYVKNALPLIAIELSLSVRFLDDIFNINCPNFKEHVKEIYPGSLPLTLTAEGANADFLDTTVVVTNGTLKSYIYNKTDHFNFNVIHYGFADSNVHSQLGPRVFKGELIRFARIASTLDDFERRCRDLFHVFLAHGFSREVLVHQFFKFASDNDLLLKFNLIRNSEVLMFVTRVFGN